MACRTSWGVGILTGILRQGWHRRGGRSCAQAHSKRAGDSDTCAQQHLFGQRAATPRVSSSQPNLPTPTRVHTANLKWRGRWGLQCMAATSSRLRRGGGQVASAGRTLQRSVSVSCTRGDGGGSLHDSMRCRHSAIMCSRTTQRMHSNCASPLVVCPTHKGRHPAQLGSFQHPFRSFWKPAPGNSCCGKVAG